MVARWILSRRVSRGEKSKGHTAYGSSFLGCAQRGGGDYLRGMKVYPLYIFFLVSLLDISRFIYVYMNKE